MEGFGLCQTFGPISLLSNRSFHRPDIDGLRALAILGVLAFHAFPQAVPGGFVGVDVFFVISGYVVTLSLLGRAAAHERNSVTGFYGRRVRRLFPALLCVFLATACAGYFLLSTPQLALLGKHILGSAGFAQNLVLWGESGYFDAASHEKWLLHLWSLGIEEQFYLLLPLLLLLPRPTGRHREKWVIAGLVLAALASFAFSLWQSREAPSAGFYWPLGRFWEFFLGVGLAGWHARHKARPHDQTALRMDRRRLFPALAEEVCALAALLALCLGFVLLTERPWQGWHFPGPLALWPALTPSH